MTPAMHKHVSVAIYLMGAATCFLEAYSSWTEPNFGYVAIGLIMGFVFLLATWHAWRRKVDR